ncbi:MAG TPA: ArdC family protein [Bryobacteraceae bacterium]|nr:ArdC family protein [Bryobacteraceae bacterium]
MNSTVSIGKNPQSGEGLNSVKRDHRQEVTDSIINMLEQGVAPWQKPWQAVGIPINPTTEKAYRGGNAVHLLATAIQRGYEDPRWMTYKQAAENDWQVKKGEKGTRIEFWEVKQPSNARNEPDQPGSELSGERDRRFIASTPSSMPSRSRASHRTLQKNEQNLSHWRRASEY